ncbi:helix-turn-helix domain-containing protein [Roseomonas gilardii]|uniref:helix-turn-helix domain-containing protein n=1 Tax=Roseomonas gilardii TaxID=257708 RepID=UPI0024A67699|nr:helix-turn-helix domain-containing protein [Roseomonas gilardii]
MSMLNTAAAVLRCFSPDHPELTTSEVADLLHLPKSNASRVLRAMREAGFIDAVPGSRRYRPGLLHLDLGQVLRNGSVQWREAQAVLLRLSRLGRLTGEVSLLDGAQVVRLMRMKDGLPVAPLPSRVPAWDDVAGLALLARLPEPALPALLEQVPPEPGAEAVARIVAAARRESLVRLPGPEERQESLAFAVLDPAREEAVAISLLVPDLSYPEGQRLLPAILTEMRSLAALIGDRDLLRGLAPAQPRAA